MIFEVNKIQWWDDEIKENFISKLREFGWRETYVMTFLPNQEHEYSRYWRIKEEWIYNKKEPSTPFTPKCVQYDVFFASVPIITFQINIYAWERVYQFGRWNNDFLHTLRYEKEYSSLLCTKLPKEMVMEIHKFLVNF
jgi:hypothetical protein